MKPIVVFSEIEQGEIFDCRVGMEMKRYEIVQADNTYLTYFEIDAHGQMTGGPIEKSRAAFSLMVRRQVA